jgi:hypothetical protein
MQHIGIGEDEVARLKPDMGIIDVVVNGAGQHIAKYKLRMPMTVYGAVMPMIVNVGRPNKRKRAVREYDHASQAFIHDYFAKHRHRSFGTIMIEQDMIFIEMNSASMLLYDVITLVVKWGERLFFPPLAGE